MGIDGCRWKQDPGSRWLYLKFVQNFWSNLKEEVLLLFEQFYETTNFDHQSFFLFISLIPKVGVSVQF